MKRVLTGFESLGEKVAGRLGHGVITAGENVYCGITRFGPGVNGNVRFCQQDQGCYTLGLKAVERLFEKGCASPLGCIAQGTEDIVSVVQELGAATIEFQNAVRADGPRRLDTLQHFVWVLDHQGIFL